MKPTITGLLLIIFLYACGTQPNVRDVTQSPKTMCGPNGVSVDALADTDQPAPLFDGLGKYDFPITTSNKKAARYFLQGFQLANGFNHAEAARSFKYAAKLDPDCAMCYWGLAYVLGPNYNGGMQPEVVEIAHTSIQKAVSLKDKVSPKEGQLIDAMAKRYAAEPPENRMALDEAYADHLRVIYKQFPEDENIGVLLAEALMVLHPWDLWTKSGEPQPWTGEIVQILEDILVRNPDNIPGVHLYIHATEASPNPGKALKYAVRLPDLAPAAGHLVHMPSHTYIRTGNYHEGTLTNMLATEVDSLYITTCHAAGVYPLAYYPHNIHFLAACAALEGDSKLAIGAAYRIAEKIDTVMMREPILGTLQHYWVIPLYTLVKFAAWDEILTYPKPAADLAYPLVIWHYARGMAYLATDELEKAQAELLALKQQKEQPAIQELTVWDINSMEQLTTIAEQVLAGEIAAKENRMEAAIALLEEAILIEDRLNYNEPPDWFFSVRHHLGPILIAQKQLEKAEALYKRDLELFPETGWALNGLKETLKLQGKTAEAEQVEKRFNQAWQWADVELQASKVNTYKY